MTTSQLIVNLALVIGPLIGVIVGAKLSRKAAALLERQKKHLGKEYETYTAVWDTLLEMRRTIATLDGGVYRGPLPTMEEIRSAFDAYQTVVVRSEPFVSDFVYKPGRQIVSLGWTIFGNDEQIKKLDEWRSEMTFDAGQKYADKQITLSEEITESLKEIEDLKMRLLAAIRTNIAA